jgi:hypothetical protein
MVYRHFGFYRSGAARNFRLAAPFMILACIGCGGGKEPPKDRTTVTGTVTLNGQPLPGGTIYFESAGGIGTSMIIGDGGKYSTDRAPIGMNRVTIETQSLQYGNTAAYVKIPTKYGDAMTSGLTADVKAGDNVDMNFSLEK